MLKVHESDLSEWLSECDESEKKAKNIKELSKYCFKNLGIIPRSYRELMKLPGLESHTSLLVLREAF